MICHTSSSNDLSKNASLKNSCVAWFKLAELISRREKEKALNLYRLIAYSLNDKGYVLQVEGDILWALQDDLAIEKYSQAAYLYKKERKFLAAAAVYEHIITLQPKNINNLKSLILIYLLLAWSEKFEAFFYKLINLASENEVDVDQVWDFAKNIISFSVNSNNLESKYFDKEILSNKKDKNEYKWVIGSLKIVFKEKDKELYDLMKKHCLDNNLNFNA